MTLPLIVYMWVNNPFTSARSGIPVDDFPDLDDEVVSIVRNSAHKGHYLRTVDGGFEEELSRMAAGSPAFPPLWSLARTNTLPPPTHKVVQRPLEVTWPMGRKRTDGSATATSGPLPAEDEDIKRVLPFKKMRREDQATNNYVIPADGAVTFNDMPELLEFTRTVRDKRRGSNSSRVPILREH